LGGKSICSAKKIETNLSGVYGDATLELRKVRSLVQIQVLQLLKYPKTGHHERNSDVNGSKLLRCQKIDKNP